MGPSSFRRRCEGPSSAAELGAKCHFIVYGPIPVSVSSSPGILCGEYTRVVFQGGMTECPVMVFISECVYSAIKCRARGNKRVNVFGVCSRGEVCVLQWLLLFADEENEG